MSKEVVAAGGGRAEQGITLIQTVERVLAGNLGTFVSFPLGPPGLFIQLAVIGRPIAMSALPPKADINWLHRAFVL